MSSLNKYAKGFHRLLFDGDVVALDDFIKHYKTLHPYDEDIKNLSEEILKESYGLFSFRSLSTDLKHLNQERKTRELAVLHHFSLKHQMEVLTTHVDNIEHHHIEALKFNHHNINLNVFGDVAHLVGHLLLHEKFPLLDLFLSKMNIDFHTPTLLFYRHYKKKYSLGSFAIELDSHRPLFAAATLHMSQGVLDYMEKKGVDARDLFSHVDILTMGYSAQECRKENQKTESLLSKNILTQELIPRQKSEKKFSRIKKL